MVKFSDTIYAIDDNEARKVPIVNADDNSRVGSESFRLCDDDENVAYPLSLNDLE